MKRPLFTHDAKLAPYWWDDVPRPALPEVELPRAVDVAIVGSGYTGLHAALQTARGGRHTVVFDAEDAGFGCSTRNGGQISTSVKPSLEALARRLGPQKALDIHQEGRRSLAWIGRFRPRRRHRLQLRRRRPLPRRPQRGAVRGAREARRRPAEGTRGRGRGRAARRAAPRDRHRRLFRRRHLYAATRRCIPARYHRGILERAQAAGAQVIARCPVTTIARDGDALPRHHRARSRRGARCRCRHQRLYRRRAAVAAAPRDPDRQLHHRHRAAAGRLVIDTLIRATGSSATRARWSSITAPRRTAAASCSAAASRTTRPIPRSAAPLLHRRAGEAVPGARQMCASATPGAASSPTRSTS